MAAIAQMNKLRNTNPYTPSSWIVNSAERVTTTGMYIDGLMLRNDTTLMWRFDGGYISLIR